MKHFVSADAVCSEAFGTDAFEEFLLNIRLYCIMYFQIMLLGKFRYVIDSLSEQLHVVIIEWSGDFVELFYRAVVKHFALSISRVLHYFRFWQKTIAKIAKKSVILRPD